MQVIIIGKTGEGKSTVAKILQKALNAYDITHSLLDDPGEDEMNMQEMARRAAYLPKNGTVVDIETRVQPLEWNIHGVMPTPVEQDATEESDGMKCTQAEVQLIANMQQLVDDFYATYPNVKEIMDICKKHVAENKYIKTSFGTFKIAGAKTGRVSSSKGTKGNIPQKRK